MISVLLVDDHDLVRAGVGRLLADVPDITVIGAVNSGEEAVKFVREHSPQVIIMDVKMPGMGGLEATRKMVKVNPNVKIIALTVYGDEPFPSKLLQAGASGYLTKGADIAEMVNAIKTVYQGKRYLGSEIAQQLALKPFSNDENSVDILSERELQILLMITSGEKVLEISNKLCLSPKTVNSYRYRIFEKLDVKSDVELTHFAIRYGLLDMETTS